MSADPRAEFEAWFATAYGAPPAAEWLLANLGEAARIEAFMGGAWAAWQHFTATVLVPDADGIVTVDMQAHADAGAADGVRWDVAT